MTTVHVVTYNTDEGSVLVGVCATLEGCKVVIERDSQLADRALTSEIYTVDFDNTIPTYVGAETANGVYWSSEVEVQP